MTLRIPVRPIAGLVAIPFIVQAVRLPYYVSAGKPQCSDYSIPNYNSVASYYALAAAHQPVASGGGWGPEYGNVGILYAFAAVLVWLAVIAPLFELPGWLKWCTRIVACMGIVCVTLVWIGAGGDSCNPALAGPALSPAFDAALLLVIASFAPRVVTFET